MIKNLLKYTVGLPLLAFLTLGCFLSMLLFGIPGGAIHGEIGSTIREDWEYLKDTWRPL